LVRIALPPQNAHLWPYGLIVLVALLVFALRGHREVELTLPLALHSLKNYKHIVLLALFFLMTRAQFPSWTRAAYGWSALVTLAMGVWLEIGEAVTGRGHCRVRDLVPDTAGILLGAVIALAWDALRNRARKT
jgi:hypothetical protein